MTVDPARAIGSASPGTGHAVVVSTDLQPVGIVSKTDVERALRLSRLRADRDETDKLAHHH